LKGDERVSARICELWDFVSMKELGPIHRWSSSEAGRPEAAPRRRFAVKAIQGVLRLWARSDTRPMNVRRTAAIVLGEKPR